MKKVLYIGRFGFPDTASGMRVFRMGKLMRKKGYDVEFLRYHAPADDPMYRQIEDFSYTQLHISDKTFADLWDLYTGINTCRKVMKYIAAHRPDIIILYNDLGYVTRRLIPYCRKNGIQLGADATEWYERRSWFGLEAHIARIVDCRIRKQDTKLNFIISISPYLTEYYRKQGCRVFQVAPLMDEIQSHIWPRYRYGDGSSLNIGYAGCPGAKDRLGELISAVAKLNASGIRVHLDLIGVDRAYVQKFLEPLGLQGNGIAAHGVLSHDQTIEILKKADFTTLFRENLRYAKAGFSTKFAESLSLGVPVICNAVGGADQLLVGSSAGILLPDGSCETILHTFQSILEYDDDFYKRSFCTAEELARKSFSYEAYLSL